MIPCQGTTQAAGSSRFRPPPGRDPGLSRSPAGAGFREARTADCRTGSATRTARGGGAVHGTAVDGRAGRGGRAHRLHDALETRTPQRNHNATSASLVTELNIMRMLTLTSNCSATNGKHNRHAEQRRRGPTATGGVGVEHVLSMRSVTSEIVQRQFDYIRTVARR
jgi:hypothetical protein